MKCVGIDIGTFSVKVAVIEASSRASVLTQIIEFPFSPDPQKDRQLQLIEILRSLASQVDLSSTRFAIAVPQHLTIGRLRSFPFRERAKILKSLPFDLEDDIPLDPDETAFEAKIVEFIGKGAQAWCVAAPRETVREALQSAAEGGIDPEIVSVEGLALANLYERWQLPPAEANSSIAGQGAGAMMATDMDAPQIERPARVTISIGHARTLVLVHRDGALVSARSLMWGGQQVANSIAAVFAVPYFEALKILETKSFVLMNKAGATRDQVALSKSVSDAVDLLARPLKLALLETKSEHNVVYSDIELTGGASQIQNLAPYLTQALEIPCNISQTLASVKHVAGLDTPQNHAVAGVAVGLAIEALKRPRNPAANLRRGELARQNKSAQVFWERWGSIIKTGAVAFVVLLVFAIAREEIAISLAERAETALVTVAKNSAPEIQKPSEATIERYVKKQRDRISARQKLAVLDDFNSSLDILKAISSQVPAKPEERAKYDLNVGVLKIDNERVFIQGTIGRAHQAQLKTWLERVARTGTLKDATPEGNPPKGTGGVVFAYSMEVNRLP